MSNPTHLKRAGRASAALAVVFAFVAPGFREARGAALLAIAVGAAVPLFVRGRRRSRSIEGKRAL